MGGADTSECIRGCCIERQYFHTGTQYPCACFRRIGSRLLEVYARQYLSQRKRARANFVAAL
jgi:hypothetical protein